jgi:hypothetical protein
MPIFVNYFCPDSSNFQFSGTRWVRNLNTGISQSFSVFFIIFLREAYFNEYTLIKYFICFCSFDSYRRMD